MKAVFTALLLLPLTLMAQKTILPVAVSTSTGSGLGPSFGAGAAIGRQIYKGGYLTLAAEVKKCQFLANPIIPISAGILYAPKENKPLSPIGQIALGYSIYSEKQVNGWFYTGMFLGIKANTKVSPFFMAGITRTNLSEQDSYDHMHVIANTTFEAKVGLIF